MSPESATSVAAGYRVGDLLIDMRLRRVTRDGTDLGIVGKSFELLVTLARAAPRVVPTEELMERVWPGVVVNPETVTQRVKLLRRSLADDAENPRYLVVLRGYGYRMAMAVEIVEALPDPAVPTRSATAAQATSVAVPLAPAASPDGRWTITLRAVPALLALALLLSAVAGVTWQGLSQRSALPRPAEARIPSLSAVPRPSVAVLPFVNLTGSPAKDYVGDGMAEELINSLARVSGLKVPARTSTFAYKGRNADVRQIAGDLGVATVLEGSVRSAGEHLRIGVRLVDAANGYQIWSQDYDRQFTDIFRLQDDVAAQIVQALRGYMNTELPAPSRRTFLTRDVQAYDLFLQAKEVFRGTPTTAAKAIAFIDQALARDPDFADALAQRAALRAMPVFTGARGSASVLEEVDRDAARALALDPSSPEGHATQEMVQALNWRWLEAERSYRATLVLGANDPYFRDFHSTWLLRPAGQLRQDESELIASYQLAPAHGYTLHELAVTESLLGHDAEAVHYVELFHELAANGAPVDGFDALPYARRALRARRYPEAAKWMTLALSEPLRAAGGTAAIRALCVALANPTRRQAADRALRSFIPHLLVSDDDDRIKMFFVDALVTVDDLDEAYAMMRQFLDQHVQATGSGGLEWSEIWAPEMRTFRQDPRFVALVSRMNLPAYWKVYGPPDACEVSSGTPLECR